MGCAFEREMRQAHREDCGRAEGRAQASDPGGEENNVCHEYVLCTLVDPLPMFLPVIASLYSVRGPRNCYMAVMYMVHTLTRTPAHTRAHPRTPAHTRAHPRTCIQGEELTTKEHDEA